MTQHTTQHSNTSQPAQARNEASEEKHDIVLYHLLITQDIHDDTDYLFR